MGKKQFCWATYQVIPEMCPVYLSVEQNWAIGFFGFSSVDNVLSKKMQFRVNRNQSSDYKKKQRQKDY